MIARLMDLDAIGMRLTGASRQFGLGIEQIHLAGAAVLNQLNDRLGFGGKVRAAGRQIAVNLNRRWLSLRRSASTILPKPRQLRSSNLRREKLYIMLAIMIVYTGIVK